MSEFKSSSHNQRVSLDPSFPGFDGLYLLEDPLSDSHFRGRFGASARSLELTRGEETTEIPVAVEWDMGEPSPTDVIWTTSVHPLILHCRVIEVLSAERLTGWESFSVCVTDKFGAASPSYAGLRIIGRCGSIDLAGSSVVLKRYPAGWYPQLQGHYFKETSWDGSDLFMHGPDVAGGVTAHILVTDAVRKAFVSAKVRNVRFTRLTEVMVSSSVYEIGSPHLLPDDFQERVNAAYARRGVSRPAM